MKSPGEIELEWRQGLSAGDEVAVFSGGISGGYSIATVESKTKTQISVRKASNYEMRFSIKTGRPVGNYIYVHVHRILPVTDEIRATIQEQENAKEFKELVLSRPYNLEPGEIAVMLAALKAYRAALQQQEGSGQ